MEGLLLTKLGRMLGDDYNLQKGAKKRIRYIQKELESMQVALEKVSKVPPDKQVKLWASEVRIMSYQVEDTVDSYMVTIDPPAQSSSTSTSRCCFFGGDIRGMLPRNLKARRDIAAEIKRIREEVQEVAGRYRDRYQAKDNAAELVVGIDHSIEQTMELLSVNKPDHQAAGSTSTSSDEEEKKVLLRLVSIVGPPGIGKTTLANAVYQKLRGQFHCAAFVSVSLNPNLKSTLTSILRQVNKSMLPQESHRNHDNNWSEKEVIDRIRDVLEDKRYLIVIDDIRCEPAWKDLECVLVPNRLGSRIITTSRDTDVAKLCCSCDNVDGTMYQLGPLSGVESEKLFYNKVFSRGICPPELKDISSKILDKCKGLPLAIVSIAGLLTHSKEHTEDQWVGIYSSIDIGIENRHGVKDMRLILSLRYSDMPSQLRACFLYLSMFPEKHVIGRHDLIWRWIAEGFIHGKQDDDDSNDLYEVGDDYFDELISRNLIQPAQVDTLGRAQACTVHDVVLKLVNSLSAEEDFAMILNGQPFPSQQDRIHRLSLRNNKEEHGVPKTVKRLPHLRTLVVSPLPAISMPSLSIFPVLRVLDLEHCTSHIIKDVGILVLLRYLKLGQAYYGSHHIELPQEIGALRFLEILDLKDARVQGLPETFVQLTQLRVLKLSLYSWDKSYEKCLIKCLCRLEKLETLYISVAANVSLDFMLSVDWPTPYLRRFTTRFHEQSEHILRPGSLWRELSSFSVLPSWLNSLLSNLSDLSIMVTKLQQRDLEVLSQFPILVTLDLEVIQACEEGRLVISGHETAFQCLSNLKFASRAMGLLFTPGAMQKLHKLYLCFSVADTKEVHFEKKDEGDFQFGLENLTSLEAVEVEIDCRFAWRRELVAAEVALHTAAKLNPNHPAFDLRKYFEREMLSEALFSEHKRAEEELAGLSGGGNGGVICDINDGDDYTPIDLSLSILRQITDDFSRDRQIGTGGFAVVYKGILRNGTIVAVKKLNDLFDIDEKKFSQEIKALMKTKHENVVRFLGYCADTQGKGMEYEGKFIMADSRNRLLCFEYIPNGSLDKYITDASRGLEWRDRYQIIKGIVHGLHYLHDQHILHLDLKPANILLDATMTPKIADFGLSRCFDENQTRIVTSNLVGSKGYIAPESYNDNSNIQITFKSDIYSLGVIIMEILTGDKGYSAIENVVERWKKRLELDTLQVEQVEQVRVCTEIGIECINADPAKRPLTPRIINMLDHSFLQEGASTTTTLSSVVQAGLYKIGPYGGNEGTGYDIGVPPHHLESITIHSGHVVDSLAFSYTDHSGHQFNAGPWGGRGGAVSTIPLGPSEYLKRVSGQTGTYFEDHIVKSLTFVTNVASYGPFGIHSGENQFVVEARRNNCIVGFFSNAGQYVDSIGFYARPL